MMKHIGLFFGSFNPVHNGHLIIANFILEYTELDRVFFIVSPQNPFKKQSELLEDHHRFAMLNEAIGDTEKYHVSDIEFKLSKPSYTVDTLAYLTEKYPDFKFSLIMGSDNLVNFHKWKNAQYILDHHKLFVYPRPGFDVGEFIKDDRIEIVKAPLMELSSTFIRTAIKEKKDVRFFMPERAWNYMKEMHFYEK
jgi:nicotinate-nucleotide adenylyltransferase